MQDFGTKADNSPPPGGQLSAAEFNNLATENENAVLRSGIALSGASATQLAESMFLHGVKAETFQDSGAANAYVATPVSGASGVLLPASYANMGGAVIAFKASAANTGASTLNIGQTTGTLLGSKPIRTSSDIAISASAIAAGQYVAVVYNPAFNTGSGAWELLPWSTVAASPVSGGLSNARMNIPTASTSATWVADEALVKTGLGGQGFLLPVVSLVINTAGTGIGGMDTGLAPISGDVAVYLAYNPTTNTRGLFGQDVTAIVAPEQYGGANRPSGFTATQLVAVLKTNASRQFVVSYTSGRRTTIADVTVLNTSAGLTLSLTSIAAAAPKNAIRASGTLAAAATSGSGGVSTTISGFASGLGSQSTAGYSTSPNGCNTVFRDLPLGTAQTIWVTTALAGPGTGLFTVTVKEYEI